MLTSIASFIYTAMKTIPMLMSLFEQVQKLWMENLFVKAQGEVSSQTEKIYVLQNKIKNATSDNERRVLADLLNEQLQPRNK